MKKHLLSIAMSAICLSVNSCNTDNVITTDGGEEDFSLSIAVVDSNHNPAPGLVISAWNLMEGIAMRKIEASPLSPQNVEAISTIGFEVPEVAHVYLGAYDLNDHEVGTIVDLPAAAIGSHKANFSLPGHGGTRVVKCRLVATSNSSGALLFRDSIYAVLWQFDKTLSAIGSTSPQGLFQTRDSPLFPNVLALPPLVATDATGPVSLGTFRISDSVTIVATDTVAKISWAYHRTIKKGKNELQIILSSGALFRLRLASPTSTSADEPVGATGIGKPSFEWKLEQNYPNPFN